jgi:hypothetical protein
MAPLQILTAHVNTVRHAKKSHQEGTFDRLAVQNRIDSKTIALLVDGD